VCVSILVDANETSELDRIQVCKQNDLTGEGVTTAFLLQKRGKCNDESKKLAVIVVNLCSAQVTTSKDLYYRQDWP